MKRAKVNFQYPTYSFRAREQDPIVDGVQTVLEQHKIPYAKAALGSGVSETTLYNWFTSRKTRRPQYATVAAVLGFAGYDLVVTSRAQGANGKARPPKIVKRFGATDAKS